MDKVRWVEWGLRRVGRRRLVANERGAALIITLFVVALVTVLVLEYHFDTSVEMELADNYASEVQAYHLALAGLKFARIVLQRDNPAYDAPDEPWALLSILTSAVCIAPEQLLEWARSLLQAQSDTERNPASDEAGAGNNAGLSGRGADISSLLPAESGERPPACIKLSIVDEARKLPINALVNRADDQVNETWRQIFESFFVSFEMPPEAVNALIDWIDVSPGYLEGGGEDEYYEGLEHPYTTPKRPMQVPGELRLVRYFDCETLAKLFPGKECKDMADIDIGTNEFLTPYAGTEPKVNVNTASEAVLNAMFPNNKVCVSSLLDNRLVVAGQLVSQPIQSLQDSATVCNTPPDPNFDMLGVGGTYFRVEVLGEVGGRIKKRVVAVLQRGGPQGLPNVVYFKVE